MTEYIEREAAIKALDEYIIDHPLFTDRDAAKAVKAKLDTVPASDVAPVRRGRWHWRGFNIQCPFCEYEPLFDSTEPLYNYCPNCGAKLEGEE